MQTTIYFRDEDAYLIRRLDEEAEKERLTRSALIMTILEKYLEKGKPPEEILVDMGVLDTAQLEEAKERAQKETISLDEILREIVGEQNWHQAKMIKERCMPEH